MNIMYSNTNRVYVNPNFNRLPSTKKHTSDSVYYNNHMHINPNFSRDIPNAQQIPNLSRKIYVNPNFINSTINITKANELNENKLGAIYSEKPYTNTNESTVESKIENSKLTVNIPVCSSSKSRYRLVRRNDIKPLEQVRQVKESCTIKINKYKSIAWHSFQKNIQNVKNDTTYKQTISSCKPFTSVVPLSSNKNSFQLIRHNIRPTRNNTLKLTQKCNPIKSKINFDSKKLKDGSMKINNIPCRLFTKYGTCLRNVHGACKYLHDKKHVSLCRKFIKGICHDKSCLLSHELSSKKMPTCYFYLKGICTKGDCPYLHVKLSEKSSICQEFLKGYCDKGDMCAHRHVRPQTRKDIVRKLSTSSKYTCNRSLKVNISKEIKSNILRSLCKQIERKKNRKKSEEGLCEGEGINDGRYFKDLQNREALCEVLKPTRCKLGKLPSFIHL